MHDAKETAPEVKFTLRLPLELNRLVSEEAEREGRTKHSHIVQILKERLQQTAPQTAAA